MCASCWPATRRPLRYKSQALASAFSAFRPLKPQYDKTSPIPVHATGRSPDSRFCGLSLACERHAVVVQQRINTIVPGNAALAQEPALCCCLDCKVAFTRPQLPPPRSVLGVQCAAALQCPSAVRSVVSRVGHNGAASYVPAAASLCDPVQQDQGSQDARQAQRGGITMQTWGKHQDCGDRGILLLPSARAQRQHRLAMPTVHGVPCWLC